MITFCYSPYKYKYWNLNDIFKINSFMYIITFIKIKLFCLCLIIKKKLEIYFDCLYKFKEKTSLETNVLKLIAF